LALLHSQISEAIIPGRPALDALVFRQVLALHLLRVSGICGPFDSIEHHALEIAALRAFDMVVEDSPGLRGERLPDRGPGSMVRNEYMEPFGLPG
jgi:hypothetical protein